MEKDVAQSRAAVLVVVLLTSFLNPFSGTSLNVAVPFIGAEFHSSATELTWIVSAYMMATVALAVPFGRIADIRGKRTILFAGIALFAVASFLVVFARDMLMFNLFRVLMGAAAAMIYATNMPILIEVYPPEMRGRVIGSSVGSVYVGLASGPVVGGLLTHYFGWRSVQILLALISLVALIVALAKLPKSAGARHGGTSRAEETPARRIDPLSFALYAVAVSLFLYGFTTFGQNLRSYIILAVGVVLLPIYLKYEMHSKAPVFEVRAFRRNATFLFANLSALFNYAATFAVGYIFAIYLQIVKGYPSDVTGLILVVQPVVMAVVAPIAGRLSDRRSPFMLAALGMAFCTVALVSFIFVGADTPLWRIIAGFLVVGFGFGLFASPNTNAIMSSVGPGDFGVASSVQNTARTMGQVIGMALITIVTNAIVGDAELAEAPKGLFVQDMHLSFSIFAVLCAVGILFSLKRKAKTDAV
ncbi:MAG: MFS transporter [Clostridiales Family XIII bacterium]|jgi:MFS family permease|nr:MFS transporter [Clostridiales Family XIII bacterium]